MNFGYLGKKPNITRIAIIEKLPNITFNEIITDTKWISAIYRSFGFSFKP